MHVICRDWLWVLTLCSTSALALSTAPSSTWQRVSDTLELGQSLRPKRTTLQRGKLMWQNLCPSRKAWFHSSGLRLDCVPLRFDNPTKRLLSLESHVYSEQKKLSSLMATLRERSSVRKTWIQLSYALWDLHSPLKLTCIMRLGVLGAYWFKQSPMPSQHVPYPSLGCFVVLQIWCPLFFQAFHP